MKIERLAVCLCGHEGRHHHDELGCVNCGCRKFALPASKEVVCPTCLEKFGDTEELAAHLKLVRKLVKSSAVD